jgi:O-antigen ligase
MTAAAPTFTAGGAIGEPQSQKSAVHYFALACVWLAVATSSLVFADPAPVDALTIGLFILLPVVGLTHVPPKLAAAFTLWLIVAAASFISSAIARDTAEATTHMIVSFYLFAACLVFAAFVAKKPEAHMKLVLNAYMVAALLAAVLGIAGYLDLFPGAHGLFTRYDRATGPFKDPNVFGPFLIPALLTCLHQFLSKPLTRSLLPVAGGAILSVGVLFSFSRGAWAATAMALALYSYLYMITAERNWDRIKLGGFALLGAMLLTLILAAALQSDAIANLFEQRAALTQSYDTGAEGRFGGQLKAFNLILDNPLGIGAQIFTHFHHHEEVHNVYLSMFLNAGWIGGVLYFLICAGTLALGFRHALKRTHIQPLFLIVYCALAGNIAEGVLIDSDHWRHFYLLMGLVWGLMAAEPERGGAIDTTETAHAPPKAFRRAARIGA